MNSIQDKQLERKETVQAITNRESKTDHSLFKSSQFNEYLGNFDDKWAIMNHLSGGMIEADKDIYEALIHNKFDEMAQEDIDALSHGNFIVDYYFDEIEGLRKTRNEWAENAYVVGLQILPTTFCNYRCPYCYEGLDEKKHTMSKDVMDDIIIHVQKTIKPTTKSFNVSWYGGEPLLAVKQIEYLSDAFLNIAREKSIKYQGFLITNGYLLNPENVDMLVKCKVDAIQVTLDGPKRIHDKRRILSDGSGTWQKIVDNLKYVLSKRISVTVRVNIDQTNIDFIDELFEELENEHVFDKVKIAFGVVQTFGNTCKSVEDTVLTLDESDKKIGQKAIQEKINNRNAIPYRMMPNFVGCVAVASNSFIVGPSGELYRCSKTIGLLDETFGHISNPDKTHRNYQKWENINNLDMESCVQCSLPAICNGVECAFDIVINGKNKNSPCSKKFRDYYIEKLKDSYLQIKRNQNTIKI